MKRFYAVAVLCCASFVSHAYAGEGETRGPWRGAGSTPCWGSDGGTYKCPPAAETVAVRAGRLFDAAAGRMLTQQVVLISGERIVERGPESAVRIPPGTRVIDLSRATVLPGLIDA